MNIGMRYCGGSVESKQCLLSEWSVWNKETSADARQNDSNNAEKAHESFECAQAYERGALLNVHGPAA
jgi:hypothetical protein